MNSELWKMKDHCYQLPKLLVQEFKIFSCVNSDCDEKCAFISECSDNRDITVIVGSVFEVIWKSVACAIVTFVLPSVL